MILAPRYLPRLAATIGLFTRYGLADFAKQQGLHGLAQEAADDAPDDSSDSPEKAAAFRRRLVELGPAYVKLGQLLSTRPDLLPETYIRELEHLQDDVDPIPLQEVEQVIQEELSARISKLFASFDDTPLGSASLGQVHAAQLRDGRDVVVKVQRPHIRQQLADDLEYFHELARFLTEHTGAGARVDFVGIIEQLEQALADELDYRIEARNAATFRRSLSEFPRILIPRVVEAYSTERVLTTERVRGVKIDAVSPLARLDYEFRPVAEDLTRAYLKQILIDGHFHADPHPGNVFVVMPSSQNPMTPSEVKAIDRREHPRPPHSPLARIEEQAEKRAAPQPDDIDVKLALIDFGMTARLSTSLRDQIVKLLMDIADNSGDEAAEVLVEVGDALPEFDRQAFVREIGALMARNYDLVIGELETGKVLYELINAAFQRGLRLPAELTLLAKALFNLDAVTRSLDATFSPIPTIREFGNQIAGDRARHEFNPRHLFQLAADGSDLLLALPHRVDLITERMAANEFQTRIDVPQLTLMMHALQKVANRVFSGLVIAGLLVASAMLMPYRRALGTIGFILAAIVGGWMVVNIWWNDRD
jgi:predicted unusual protein kinase regulating ubiquinone biosynthesis (AarF/ABC1/UbiB family)